MHDLGGRAALVEVYPPDEHQHLTSGDLDRPYPALVARDGRRDEAGQVGVADLDAATVPMPFGGVLPARAEDDGGVVAGHPAAPRASSAAAASAAAKGSATVPVTVGDGIAATDREQRCAAVHETVTWTRSTEGVWSPTSHRTWPLVTACPDRTRTAARRSAAASIGLEGERVAAADERRCRYVRFGGAAGPSVIGCDGGAGAGCGSVRRDLDRKLGGAAARPRRARPRRPHRRAAFLACEVTDTGGINDRSFNASAYNGLKVAAKASRA